SARAFARIARFTKICSIAQRRGGFARRSCANWSNTNRLGGLETAAPRLIPAQFISAAVHPPHSTLPNWNCCCADFTKSSNYRNWSNGRLKQIREASPRERQRF